MFREARPDDLPALLRLYSQLHPADSAPDDAPAVLDQILATAGLHLFVLEVEGDVVATAYLNVIPNLTRGASPYAVVENVVVEQSRRGTGLGKATMAGTLAAAGAAGCYKVMLLTGSRSAGTHAFYRSCGLSGDEKTAYVAHPPQDRPQPGP
ncbi:N-acetyltransferase family protein [Cellulomonas sp. P5_C5]